MIGAPRNGWIGIDVGAATIKLAQLARRKGKVELIASATAPRAAPGENAAVALRNDIETVLAIAGQLNGKRTAAVLSMNDCQLEPGQATAPLAGAADSETAEWSVASWPTGIEAADPEAGWYTLAVDAGLADTVAEGLLAAGLSCRTIDGGPMAIARAVGMVAPPDATVAAIDWGWSSATFVSAVSGYPIYVRTLKNCGLREMVTILAEELGVTATEARDSLLRHSPAAPGETASSHAEDPVADELAVLVRPVFDRLLSETRRTLKHLQSHRRQANPSAICLLGGGATLPGVTPWLKSEIQLPTTLWSPPGAAPDSQDWPILGPSIALSALAWEAR